MFKWLLKYYFCYITVNICPFVAMLWNKGGWIMNRANTLAYIIIHSVKTKTNPYKGEAFTEFKYYKDAKARADIK